MSAASDSLENAILNHFFRNTSQTPASSLFLAAFTTSASLANLEAGTLTGEVSGGSYARQAITFGAPSGGTSTNSGTITFPSATANWGTIRFVAVMDASTAGNVLAAIQLTSDITINSGNTLQFNAGAVSIQAA